ncbi:MAG: hypothetical protein K1X92_14750 [Bacteroidia bacterium]|nr:hypothetical protein [Bacteroidia bacterium]
MITYLNRVLIVLLSVFMLGCSTKWNPKKYRMVEITDTGEIYSTLNLEKRNDAGKSVYRKIMIKKRWVPDSLFRTISGLANENKWPAGMRSAQQRFDNSQKMRRIKAYTAIKFKGKYVLYVPAKENNRENKDLAAELHTDKDFYIIIGKRGVTKKDEWLKGYENWKRPPRAKIREEAKEPQAKPAAPAPGPKNPRDKMPQTVSPPQNSSTPDDPDNK